MKKLLLGTVALVAFGTSAMAADMPVYKAAPLPVWTWSGVYFGAHAGGAWGKTDAWTSDFNCAIGNLCDTPGNQKPGGWVVGGQAGARWQWGALVLGVEGTLAASRIFANDPATCVTGVNTCIFGGAGVAGAGSTHYETSLSTLYSATGQIGWAFNRTLWYVKGGWAGGELRRKMEFNIPGDGIAGGETRQATGWTAGVGVEYLVLQNLSLGIEYDYFRLRGSSFTNDAITSVGTAAFQETATSVTVNVHQV